MSASMPSGGRRYRRKILRNASTWSRHCRLLRSKEGADRAHACGGDPVSTMQSRLYKTSITAYIGLGSNLNDPVNQLHTALAELGMIPQTQVLKKSSLYRSPAL